MLFRLIAEHTDCMATLTFESRIRVGVYFDYKSHSDLLDKRFITTANLC